MFVVLNNGTFKAALPNMPATLMEQMITLRMRDEQALHDAADRAFPRANEQVDVVAHQTIAKEIEGLALLEIGDGLEERRKVASGRKDVLTIVATIDYVVDQAIGDRT